MKETKGKQKACPIIGHNLKAIVPINDFNEFLLNSHLPKIAIMKKTHTIQLVIQKYNKIQ